MCCLATSLPFLPATSVQGQLLGAAAGVSTVSTVRENEFRSRWANYQVDRQPTRTTAEQQAESKTDEDHGGLLSLVSRSFSDHFRNGPLQLRADLSAGYEFTNEASLRAVHPNGSESSPFVGPAFGIFYNRELGPATVSARYSAGYVYYLDQSYLAVNHNGGILSQTAGLDIDVQGGRTTFRSSATGSYGNGNDIESGSQRDRLAVTEALDAIYTLTEFTQLGASGVVSYTSYSGGGAGTDTNTTSINGTLYGDYVVTPKTRLRLEFGAGDQSQNAGGTGVNNSDRSYYQALLKANYLPSPKLTLDGGVGLGSQRDSGVQGKKGSTLHPVYTLTARYVPSEKLAASFHAGYEGVDVDPDLSLLVEWQPRLNTSVNLSVYQNSNFSTFIASQNLVTRGFLISAQQKVLQKVDVGLAGGAEQSQGYSTTKGFADPYYFGSITLLWQFNSSLALQAYYRGFTGQAGGVSVNNQGLQSRASASLRLTF